MTYLEELSKGIKSIINDFFKTSFGQSGLRVITDTSTYTGKFTCFYPTTDGQFGSVISNAIGLTNSNFYAGIPIYFDALSVILQSGSGYLYNK